MEVFSRIKSAVTSALPVGNPITGEFEILGQRASGGPGLLWKIYDSIQKSTRQEASVFLFEKKQLDRFSKSQREVVLEVLKKGVSQLTRLRHPKILSVLHTLEDSRESLAFATEPVFASLSNLLGQHDNLPAPTPVQYKDFKFYDVETKYGLIQILDGLTFLHTSVKMVHGNVCPESIYINRTGCWKLAGFEFCIANGNQQGLQPYFTPRDWDPYMTPVAQPRLNYLAPEYSLASSCDTASDMFSVGVLIFAINNSARPVMDSLDDWATHKRNCEELKSLRASKLSDVPDAVRDHVRMLLNVEPTVRPDTDQLAKIPYFEDVGAMTLQYLDMLVQKDNLQKSQFFKGLPGIISKLPKRVNLQRVLPSLSKECVNNNMIPFVLPCMLLIAETTTEEEFAKVLLPALIPLFKIAEPVQVMLIFLQNMAMLLNKTPQSDVRNHILPMITRALETGSSLPQMQELCLNIIPSFASLIEYTSLKNSIVPRIRKLCVNAPTLCIRVNCLVCLGKLLEHLDKWYVLDEVLPILLEVPTKEPAVLMSVLGVLRVMLTHKKLGITKELMSGKVLPFLFPLCIDNGLNLMQFNAFISTIKDMVSRVETEHRTKLEQLNAVQTEQRTLQKFAQESVTGSGGGSVNGGVGGGDTMMDSFLSDIGFGKFTSSGSVSSNLSALNPFDEPPVEKSNEHSASKPTGAASLTMAEKEKLAREQELQKQFKSQPSLLPASTADNKKTQAPKDLTSSLMSSNLSNLSLGGSGINRTASAGSFGTQPMGSGSFGTQPMGSGSFGTQPMGSVSFGTQPMGSVSFGTQPMGSFGTQPMGSDGVAWGNQPTSAGTKPVNMAALDSLLPTSKPRMSMNQMSPMNNTVTIGNNIGGNNMGGNMGGNSMGGNMGMGMNAQMSSPSGFVRTSAPGPMYGQSANVGNPFYANVGGMGGSQMSGAGLTRPQIGTPNSQGGTSSNKPLSSRDIDDLLG